MRNRLTDQIAKTSSITQELDKMATEIEQSEPIIAMAIDKVSDQLEFGVDFKRSPHEEEGSKKYPNLYHDEKSHKEIHDNVQRHYEEYKRIVEQGLHDAVKVDDIEALSYKVVRPEVTKGKIELRYFVTGSFISALFLSEIDKHALINPIGKNKLILDLNINKIEDKPTEKE